MTLDVIKDANLSPTEHGFFTRVGGVSSGVFSGLNCGQGSSDLASAVEINRQLAAAAVGVTAAQMVSLHQIHSSKVIRVKGPISGPRPQADAMVTSSPGMALGVLSADCQPVLFADHSAGVVGAAHAGWKGSLGGVLAATVDAMEQLGARRNRIVAVIGPCISQKSYEVGAEFRDVFLSSDRRFSKYFAPGVTEKYQFDLPGFGVDRLLETGVCQASWTGHCTYEDPGRFFSYRYGQHHGHSDYGRLLSVIRT